jgi:hypothetical protein
MPSKTYTITPAKFAAAQQDLDLPEGNSGTFVPPGHSEITLGYALVGDQLQITILHEAWYETADEVWNALNPYLI